MTTFLTKHFWGLSGILCLHVLVLYQMGHTSGQKPNFSLPNFTPIQLETVPDLPQSSAPALMRTALSTAPLPTQVKPEPKPAALLKPLVAEKTTPQTKSPIENMAIRSPIAPAAPESSRAGANIHTGTSASTSASPNASRQTPAPISTGAGTTEASVTPPIYQAAYLSNPEPSYPKLSREAGEEGTVRLKVEVSDKGRALSVVIAKSSGSDRLDAAALKAVSHWQFVPAKRGQQPIQQALIVPIYFSLQNS